MDITTMDRSTLKGYFARNKVPTEQNFAEFINAGLNQREDGIAKTEGNPLSLQAIGETSGSLQVLDLYRTFTDATPTWRLSLNAWATPSDAGSAKNGLTVSDGGGTHRLHIQAGTGHVGLGTLDPQTHLHVRGGNNPTLRIQSDGTNEISGRLSLRQNNLAGADVYYDGTGNQEGFQVELFHSNDTSKGIALHINNKDNSQLGWVGLGTTAPEAPLHVAKASAAGSIVNPILQLGPGSNTHMHLDEDGVHVFANNNHDSYGTLNLNSLGGNVNAAVAGALNTKQLNVSSKVAIGHDAPQALLHIKGGSNPTLRIQSDGTNEISGRLSLRQSNNTGADLYYNGTDSTEAFQLEFFDNTNTSKGVKVHVSNHGGKEGWIGLNTTNPQAPLHINQTRDVDTNQNGALLLGDVNSWHVRVDGNELQAYKGTAFYTWSINVLGGNVAAATQGTLTTNNFTAKGKAAIQMGSIAGQANLEVGRTGGDAIARFRGTNRNSVFAYSTDEHTYIRGGKTSSNVLINDDGGRVGIGTNSPQTLLHLKAGTDPTLRIQSDGTNEISGRLSLRQSNNTGSDLYYDGTNASEGFKLQLFDSNGSKGVPFFISNNSNSIGWIGINTTDPKARFHINRTHDVDDTRYGAFLLGDADGTNVQMDGNEVQAYTSGLTPGTYFINAEGGNVEAAMKGTLKTKTLSQSSDGRLKEGIHTVKEALAKVMALRGTSYRWKDEAANAPQSLGLIAQEVEQVLPELVSSDEHTGYKSLQYTSLIAVLVEAIKELNTKVTTQAQQLATLNHNSKT